MWTMKTSKATQKKSGNSPQYVRRETLMKKERETLRLTLKGTISEWQDVCIGEATRKTRWRRRVVDSKNLRTREGGQEGKRREERKKKEGK